MKPTEEKYLTVEDMATLFQVTELTIRRWVGARKVPYVKLNGNVRFVERQINQWVESKQVKTKAAAVTAAH